MRNIRLTIAYDGSAYSGWQRQENAVTVQETIEQQLAILSKQSIRLHGAGRTDAGVHALGMVAHFQSTGTIPLQAFCKGLNSMLPRDIRILAAHEVALDFHSRFNALAKTYRYNFCTGPVQIPTTRLYAAHFPEQLSFSAMKQALQYFHGTHDFSSFERSGSRDLSKTTGRGAVRTIYELTLTPSPHVPHSQGQGEYWSICVSGDGFLRQMVRNISGILIDVGRGKFSPSDIPRIMAAKDRTKAGCSAPAHGLFLEKIYYEKHPFSVQTSLPIHIR